MLYAFLPSNKLPMRPREISFLHYSLFLGMKAGNMHLASSTLYYEVCTLWVCAHMHDRRMPLSPSSARSQCIKELVL